MDSISTALTNITLSPVDSTRAARTAHLATFTTLSALRACLSQLLTPLKPTIAAYFDARIQAAHSPFHFDSAVRARYLDAQRVASEIALRNWDRQWRLAQEPYEWLTLAEGRSEEELVVLVRRVAERAGESLEVLEAKMREMRARLENNEFIYRVFEEGAAAGTEGVTRRRKA